MNVCIHCHATGLIISKYFFKGDTKPLKHYHIHACHDYGRGTYARCHMMMHIQNEEPCDCEYRYVLNYWKDKK
jgi:hypothetical protein